MRDRMLTGIMPPLATPFDAKGGVDYVALENNVSLYNGTGLTGYVALGSNGEAVHLRPDERASVIAAVRRAAAPGFPVIAGVNELSTAGAVEATRRAADAGAASALVVTPYFYKSSMTSEVLLRYYTEVADSSPVPVLVYNIPQNTGVVIDSATIASLSRHENVVGLKDSSGNMGALAETMRLCPPGFSVLTGSGSILYPALAMGAAGAILAVACVAPRACADIFEAASKGDHSRARALQDRIAPLSHLVTAAYGVAGLKAAMEVAGYGGGLPRPPLIGLTQSQREKVLAVMRETGLFPALG
jgi:4-hydroxy-2-oxoglutarate aldolase